MNIKKRSLTVVLLLLTALMMVIAGCAEQPATDEAAVNCSVEIECSQAVEEGYEAAASAFEDGVILAKTDVSLPTGETAYDALLLAAEDANITIDAEGEGSSVYVTGVNSLKSGDCGEMSGWTYYINGEFASVGMGAYEVQEGDEITLSYVTSWE